MYDLESGRTDVRTASCYGFASVISRGRAMSSRLRGPSHLVNDGPEVGVSTGR